MIVTVLEVRVDAEKIEELIKDYVAKMTYKPTGNMHFDAGGNAWVAVEHETKGVIE
jgi:hypothetical protein